MADSETMTIPAHVPREVVRDFDMYADVGLATVAHARYEEMLKTFPEFFYTPRNGGHWVVLGKDAVTDAFHRHDLFGSFSEGIPHPPERAEYMSFIPIQMDPPQHGPYRNIINPVLGPRAVAALLDDIRELCRTLIAAVANKGHCEFVNAISLPLPVLIFMRQMGLPQDRYKELSNWAQVFMNGDTMEIRRDSFMKIWSYLDQLLLERSENPQQDWISRLLGAELDGKQLDRARVVLPMCMVLFVGGLDTVKNSLAHFMRILAPRPDIQERLRKELDMIPEAVEEMFRLLGGTNPPRVLRVDGEFRGVPVRRDELAILVSGTAGIDPANVDRPLEFDIDREQKPHLAFGAGPHRCAGSNLARAELRIFFEEWFARIPSFRQKPGNQPRFNPGTVNAIENLELEWDVPK